MGLFRSFSSQCSRATASERIKKGLREQRRSRGKSKLLLGGSDLYDIDCAKNKNQSNDHPTNDTQEKIQNIHAGGEDNTTEDQQNHTQNDTQSLIL